MEERKKCPNCGNSLDESSILYKGYYVCSSCASTVSDSQNAEQIRKFSHYIRNLEFKRAAKLRDELFDSVTLDVNELQLFTFYSSILDLFLTRDPSKIIKFLNDSTQTDIGVVIEVINFITSLSMYIEKLGGHVLNYVSMQEKFFANLHNHEFEIAVIEVKKRFFKFVNNKSGFVRECYQNKKMSLKEVLDLIQNGDPSNMAALYGIFDEVADFETNENIEHYLLACDYALELYFEKNKKKISQNYKDYYQKAKALRKKLQIKVEDRYKWQKKTNKPFMRRLLIQLGVIIILLGLSIGAFVLLG